MRLDRQSLGHKFTAVAASLRRETCRDFDNLRASFLRFALEYLDELGPTRIVNCLGEPVVLDHACYIQIFDDEGAVSVHIPPRHFVQEVLALSSRLEMQLRCRSRRFLATIRTFLATTYLALNAPKVLLGVAVAASIGDRAALGIGEEGPESDIETDGRAIFDRWRLSKVTDYQHVPFAISSENKIRRLRRAFEWAMLLYFDPLAEFARDTKPSILKPNVSTLPVLAKVYRMPAIGRFEAWEPRFLFEFFAGHVASQGFIQPVGKRLYRACGHMLAATALEPSGERVLEKKPASLGVVIFNLLEHLVVQMARLFEASHQRYPLAAVWVERILERLEHRVSYYRQQ